MPSLVCVPILIESPEGAIAEAELARAKGADLVEFRLDSFFDGQPGEAWRVDAIAAMVADSPLPCIVTCRPTWEGGHYDGPEDERIALFERLATSDHPPAYLDVELAAYTRSANIRQKIGLCVQHPGQVRDVATRLILSIHDFEGRPADLDRRLLCAYEQPACSVVKVAFRSRSIRDNLELFEILARAPKPTIALGMGRFGVMSRVLAPKFGGLLTFASLRDESATAPGQPTIDELLGLYRFRSIGRETKVYGIIGWPVEQSMSPLIHNAGFEAVGHDGVYVPMPIAADDDDPEGSYASFKATMLALLEHDTLHFRAASVTLPHKLNLYLLSQDRNIPSLDRILDTWWANEEAELSQSGNTICKHDVYDEHDLFEIAVYNTDSTAIWQLLDRGASWTDIQVGVIGSGGVGRAAAFPLASRGASVHIYSRTREQAESLASEINEVVGKKRSNDCGRATPHELNQLISSSCSIYINCTPVGMAHGPDPDGLSIPIPDMQHITPETVFFDTVYNPVETPMLREARARGCRTIDGAAMFVRQAAAQFELWTGKPAPIELFDQLVRQKLG